MLSTTYVAVRQHGVCRGTLWRQEGTASSSSSSMTAASSSTTTNATSSSAPGVESTDYCVATSNLLAAYESLTCFQRGDVPIRLYEIVGASAASSSTIDPKSNKSFCLVTNQGTQIHCQAVTRKCRDLWLATLHAGLEQSLLCLDTTTTTCHRRQLQPPEPARRKSSTTTNKLFRAFERRPLPIKSCLSCGAVEQSSAGDVSPRNSPAAIEKSTSSSAEAASSPTTTASTTCNTVVKTKNIIYTNASPISIYGQESRCNICSDCLTAQGLVDHLQFIKTCMGTAQQERKALYEARQLCAKVIANIAATAESSTNTKSTAETAVTAPDTNSNTTTTTSSSKEATAAEAAPSEVEVESKNVVVEKDEEQEITDERKIVEKSETDDAVAVTSSSTDITDEKVVEEEKRKTEADAAAVASSTEDIDKKENDEGENNEASPAITITDAAAAPSSPTPEDNKSSDGSGESWTHVETSSSVEHAAAASSATTAAAAAGASTSDHTTTSTSSSSSGNSGGQQQQQPDWIHVSPSSASSTAVLELVQDSQRFGSLVRVSPFLEMLVEDLLLQGRIGVADFLEQLEEAVAQTETDSLAKLKKQAFRVAGDMGTAMKLLVEHALPKQEMQCWEHESASESHMMASSSSSSTAEVASGAGTETLACLLEFFLDLCDEGELSAVSFFWPQLCHLHLCMLPAENAAAVARVDLVEDFLLTVATRYSIHLALELVWSHTADLEEALEYHPAAQVSSTISSSTPTTGSIHGGRASSSHPSAGSGGPRSSFNGPTLLASSCTTHCAMSCRRRRFAVLRFVCELESLLFGHENGWGGGSVALGKMLVPTLHQKQVMEDIMMEIQQYRRGGDAQQQSSSSDSTTTLSPSPSSQQQNFYASRRLSRSARLDMLANVQKDQPPEELAKEKLRIARNADYFSGHLNFTKRICDIAEKLRFMELSQRATALEEELVLLNSSGAMGGDPLNRISPSFVRVVRVPSTEGHVFRSKERTPVLLLMEAVDEAAEPPFPVTPKGSFCEAGEGDESNSINAAANEATIDTSNTEEPDSSSRTAAEQDESTDGKASDDSKTATQLEQGETLEEDSPPSTTEADPVLTTTFSANEGDGDLSLKAQPQPLSSPVVSTRKASASSLVADPEGDILVGSSIGECRPSPGALKRFDSAGKDDNNNTQPLTPQKEVRVMVENAMKRESLQEKIGFPDLGTIRSESPSEDAAPLTPEPERPLADLSESSKQQLKQRPMSPRSPQQSRKMVLASGNSTERGSDSNNTLAPTGDVRREVLNAIMMKGKRGNSIAAGTQDSVQRSLKELERKRATALLLEGTEASDEEKAAVSDEIAFAQLESTKDKLASLGLESMTSKSLDELDEPRAKPSEEDEVMEAVRLLLIQNRVAQGFLSQSDAAKVIQHISLSRINSSNTLEGMEGGPGTAHHPGDMPVVDAGDLDPRLAGCGPLPPAVLQALTLWKGDMVTNGELLELVKKDIAFVKHSVLLEAESVDKLNEDSAFWGRFAFGERWAEKKSRILASSPQGSVPGWDLIGVIVKSNDDLRQETFVMQLIELCQEAFQLAGLELWVNPYRILATGRSTGIIEMVRNAMSFDALKKRPGYGKGGLREHLQRMTEFTADPGGSFKSAQRNFVRSLAAYSLMSYFFLFKDRHNGNLLLDTAGHVIHIDFGFVFGAAPGGSFSLESYTPFKLTEEMLEVMGGLRSPLFSEFVTLFCCGFLALQSYCDTFLTLVEITSRNSTFPCFAGRDVNEIVSKLRERFCPNLSKEDTVAFALDLIKQATTSYGTRQYDLFQYLSQGIAT